jgi:hypothetical protein
MASSPLGEVYETRDLFAVSCGLPLAEFNVALTWAAAASGFERSCTIASLQASALGEPVYRRMGFETVSEYVRYGLPEETSAPT